MGSHANHHFYGKAIFPDKEQEYIQSLLRKYRKEPASEELKKKIWDELQKEKHLGSISIPFKVIFRKGEVGKYPSQVEVILDTKV